jgi:hypothetical protein
VTDRRVCRSPSNLFYETDAPAELARAGTVARRRHSEFASEGLGEWIFSRATSVRGDRYQGLNR